MSDHLDDRNLLFAKLLQLLHEGFVEARRIGYGTRDERLIDLGDTFEIIPQLMMRWGDEGDDNLNLIRRILQEFHAKHGGRDYASLLEMSDEDFRDRFLGPHPWPETPAEIESALAASRFPHSTAGENR